MKPTKTLFKQIAANVTLREFMPKAKLVNVLPPYVSQFMFVGARCLVLCCVYDKKYDKNFMVIYNAAKDYLEDQLLPAYLHLNISMGRAAVCLMIKHDNLDLLE